MTRTSCASSCRQVKVLIYREKGVRRAITKSLCLLIVWVLAKKEEKVSSALHLCACSVASFMSNSATPRAVVRRIPLSMRFSWQEYWSGFLVPPPGDLHDQEIQPPSPTTPALAGRFFITEPPHLGSSCIVGALLLLQGGRAPPVVLFAIFIWAFWFYKVHIQWYN